MNKTKIFLLGAVFFFVGALGTVDAQGTGYYPYAIARGQDREIIRNLPIELRPSRPFHFYGNAVRRRVNNQPTPLQNWTRVRPLAPAAQTRRFWGFRRR